MLLSPSEGIQSSLLSLTLLYIIKDEMILLAMKKRGFGQGKWNGPGGKVEPSESRRQAAVRECVEETGVVVRSESLAWKAVIEFYFDGQPDWDNRCYIYLSSSVEGEPSETEEMRPHWFAIKNIPYTEMWEDDVIWLPRVLAGESLAFTFRFSAEGKMLGNNEVDFSSFNSAELRG